MRIERFNTTVSATLAASTNKSGAIDIRDYAIGVMYVGAGLDVTSLTYEVSYNGNASSPTFVQLRDGEGAAISTTTTASTAYAYPLPAEVMAARWFKVVSGGEAADVALNFDFKG